MQYRTHSHLQFRHAYKFWIFLYNWFFFLLSNKICVHCKLLKQKNLKAITVHGVWYVGRCFSTAHMYMWNCGSLYSLLLICGYSFCMLSVFLFGFLNVLSVCYIFFLCFSVEENSMLVVEVFVASCYFLRQRTLFFVDSSCLWVLHRLNMETNIDTQQK